MTFINTRDRQKLIERRLREVGYADGYARRPARYTLRTYQTSYRLGSVERDAMEEGLAAEDEIAPEVKNYRDRVDSFVRGRDDAA